MGFLKDEYSCWRGVEIPEHPMNQKLSGIFKKEMISCYLVEKLEPFMIFEKDKLRKTLSMKLKMGKVNFHGSQKLPECYPTRVERKSIAHRGITPWNALGHLKALDQLVNSKLEEEHKKMDSCLELNENDIDSSSSFVSADSDEKIRKSFAKDMKQIRPTSRRSKSSDQKLSSHPQRPSDPKINETLIMAIQSATINWSSNKQFWSLVIL